MAEIKILWVDDEIDLLKPHIIFLEKKGYTVDTCTNGTDAIDKIDQDRFDIVFLDENMPGISGLETLMIIKEKRPTLPIVMITKSEEELIMEDAIGSQISDYLIKPVNPNQILLSLKKNLDTSRLVSEKTTSNYQQEFRKISMDLMDVRTYEDWQVIYRKLLYWELELEKIQDQGMIQILETQKKEANSLFFKFIKNNYEDWFYEEDKPIMSHTAFKEYIYPNMKEGERSVLLMIDNLRFDQWKILEPLIHEHYKTVKEDTYCAILPTATQYARNAFFAGLMPMEIEKRFPKMWLNDTDEGGKNMFEKEFLLDQIKRLGLQVNVNYTKISSLAQGKKFVDNFKNITTSNHFTAVVYNFVDMLSHSRTEMEVIKELASTDKSYRSLTLSWFKNSPLFDIIKKAAKEGLKLYITTDHGTINVNNPTKLVGDKNTSLNLRYKQGKSLSYQKRDVYAVQDPHDIFLPKINVSSSYVFAKEDLFFAYPNNFNHYVKYYRNTYQHGGISLEEMIIPFIELEPK